MQAFPLNPRLAGLGASPTLLLNELCATLKAEGRPVFRLGFGQSPFPVPEPVVQALRTHAAEKSYLPVRGLEALRAAVAAFNRRTLGIECEAGDVLVGPGSKELMFLLQLVTDADLVVPSPAWVSYIPQATLLGRETIRVPTDGADRYRMDPEVLDGVLARTQDRRRILVMNYPGNPTGATYLPEELEALARVAKKHQVLILSDEIYGELHHEGTHITIGRYYPEGTVISSGLSKWCGAGGWRVGTLTFPRSKRELLDAVAVAGSETYSATSAPIQYAAITAFEGGPLIETYLNRSRAILKALGNWCWQQLQDGGAEVVAPMGGFYLFPDFSKKAKGIESSSVFCERLLAETGVALLPGQSFGRPPEELTARLAYVDFDGQRALENADPIDEAFLRRYCPQVVAGIEHLVQWL